MKKFTLQEKLCLETFAVSLYDQGVIQFFKTVFIKMAVLIIARMTCKK